MKSRYKSKKGAMPDVAPIIVNIWGHALASRPALSIGEKLGRIAAYAARFDREIKKHEGRFPLSGNYRSIKLENWPALFLSTPLTVGEILAAIDGDYLTETEKILALAAFTEETTNA